MFKDIPSLIKSARIQRGLTVNDLAEVVGVSSQTIWRWEAGKSQPSYDQLDRIFNLVGCTVYMMASDGRYLDVSNPVPGHTAGEGPAE